MVVQDAGRIINPLTLKGQVIGSLVQGLGGAFLEHLVYDEKGSCSPARSPTISCRPPGFPEPARLMMEKHPSPINPVGAKGAGEGGMVAPAA